MKYLTIALLLSPMFIIESCFKQDNHGYPKKIHFPSEGGTKIVSGECAFDFFTIVEGTDEQSSRDIDNMMEASYKWLKVRQEYGSKFLIVTAEPAPSDKKRKLSINGYNAYDYADITVVQGK